MEVVINESETLVFFNQEETYKFIQDERHKWHWLRDLPVHLQNAGKELQTILLDVPIFKLERIIESEHRNRFELGTVTEPFITSDSEEGKFIHEVIQNYDNVTGFYSIIFSNNEIKDMAYNNSTISETLRISRFEYERTTAINLSLTLGNYERFLDARRKSNFQELLKEQRNDQIEFRAKFKEISDAFKQSAQEHTVLAQHNIRTGKKFLNRRLHAIHILSKRGARKAQEFATEATDLHRTALERLKAADSAYTEQLDLKYSVKYWNSRKTAHTFSKYGWLLSVILSLVIMLGAVGLYFANGGLTTIAEHLTKRLPESLVIINDSDNKTKQESNLQNPLLKSEVATLATNITGVILLITIFSIFIRITLRQFSIHSQYALEAGERTTFIKTYLALMQEKQIKSDEDRKLILECIFKSTLGSQTPEIAFSLPIDSIMKAFGERKNN
jgi:hypothetical protein